jgi:hypothetical protein
VLVDVELGIIEATEWRQQHVSAIIVRETWTIDELREKDGHTLKILVIGVCSGNYRAH